MKAITVKQPWAWAIAHADKDIENRAYSLNCVPVGGVVAIHAGKGWDDGAGQIIADLSDEEFAYTDDKKATGVIALARFEGNVTESDSPYFAGPIGWVLEERTPMAKTLPINGKQGPWELDNTLLLRHLGFQWNQVKMDQWQLSRKADKKIVAELNLIDDLWKPKVIYSDPFLNWCSTSPDDYRTARKWAEEEACLQWCGETHE